MSQEIIVGIVAAVAAIFAATITAPRILRDNRWSIQRDLEIWKSLPPESPARRSLLKKIEREVQALDVHDQKRRHPMGIGLAVSFFVIGGALMWLMITWSGWWWLISPVVLFCLIFGIGGFALSIRKTLRDEKGNTIKS